MEEITRLREPWSDTGNQAEASMMGAFIFLGTEMMLFGGLFLVIAWLRYEHPHDVSAASRMMHYWLAGANTAVLLTSSATMALAVDLAKAGRRLATGLSLFLTAFLGLVFLGLKAVEYGIEFHDGRLPVSGSGHALVTPAERLFMDVYMIATALHGVHLTIGVALVSFFLVRLLFNRMPLPERAILVVVSGFYWHLVDVIWIFLYPLLYLAR